MTDDTDRNDREAGRQLGIAVFVFAAIGGGFAAWAGNTGLLVFAGLVALAGALAFAMPIVTIRLASGRMSELIPDPPPGAPPDRTKELLRAGEEGVPIHAVVIEESLSPRGRKVAGIAMMIGGIVVVFPCVAFLTHDEGSSLGAGLFVSFIGLVVWYRTL